MNAPRLDVVSLGLPVAWAAAPFFWLGGLAAQTTHFVGPTGLAEIREALAIAVPGDVIAVEPGSYAQFDATIGVTIRAVVPGTVTVRYDAAFAPPGCLSSLPCVQTQGPTRFAAPPGQWVHVVGLVFEANQVLVGTFPLSIVHRIVVEGGGVSFDRCVLHGFGGPTLQVDGATVAMQDCEVDNATLTNIVPDSPGIRATNAVLDLIDSSIRGNPVGTTFYFPSEALEVVDCKVHGSHVDLLGGSSVLQGGAPAVRATGSVLWFSDSTLTAGNGACAIVASGTAAHVDRCALVSNGVGCSNPTGLPLLGVSRAQPLENGSTFALDFTTAPNGLIAVFANFDVTTLTLPHLRQPLLLPPFDAIAAALLLADGAGQAIASWPIPAGAQFVDRQLWFQGLTGPDFPLQLSPLAGGVVR
jgi:hypothetical protein